MNVGPYMVYVFVYLDVYPLYKIEGFGGPKFCLHKSPAVFGHFGHQTG